MDKGYSILIVPRQGSRLLRVVFSRRVLNLLFWGAVAWLALGALALGDYFWLKLERRAVQRFVVEAQAQQEQLSTLYEKAKETEELLVHWKGLRQKVLASLPPGGGRSARFTSAHKPIRDLEKHLDSLKDELKHLIASTPAEWPVTGRVSSGLGPRSDPWTGQPGFHAGLDIPNPVGTPVRAPADGVVEFVGAKNLGGRVVVIDHGQGIVTKYAHLSKTNVQKGQPVRKGEQIAAVGNTGKSTSSHLHYELRVSGVPIDPRRHLLRSQAEIGSQPDS